jgi:dienelactone hydrolase
MKSAMSIPRASVLVFALALAAGQSGAEVKVEAIDYQQGESKLTGYLAYDDALKGRRPGVVVVHEWWGLNDYAKQRATMLAELGYVAFALDMYGDNRVTEHGKQAGEWMSQITANVDSWRDRALAGLEVLKASDHVDTDHLAAIGYCFGAATVMQMAYAGADLDGVASFHGPLPPPPEGSGEAIKARFMVAHGNDDEFVPAERVAAFMQAAVNEDVDVTFHGYKGVHHSFTNPGADSHGIPNLKYDAVADQDSWEALQAFFVEIFE